MAQAYLQSHENLYTHTQKQPNTAQSYRWTTFQRGICEYTVGPGEAENTSYGVLPGTAGRMEDPRLGVGWVWAWYFPFLSQGRLICRAGAWKFLS